MIVSQYNSTMSAKEYQRVKGLVRMKTNFFKQEKDQFEKGKARYYANQAYEGQIVQNRQEEQVKRVETNQII